MEQPENPQSLIGSIVRSLRDPDRLGRIEAIGVETDRPFVRWSGNPKPFASEWRHIELFDLSPYSSYAAAIGLSMAEFEAGLKRVIQVCGVTSAEAFKNIYTQKTDAQ